MDDEDDEDETGEPVPVLNTHQEKINAIRDTADEVGGRFRDDYTGRMMYGGECYGISCDDPTSCIEVAASKGLRGARTDSLGRGAIVYWPSVKKIEKARPES